MFVALMQQQKTTQISSGICGRRAARHSQLNPNRVSGVLETVSQSGCGIDPAEGTGRGHVSANRATIAAPESSSALEKLQGSSKRIKDVTEKGQQTERSFVVRTKKAQGQ